MKVTYFCHELAPHIIKRDEEAIHCFASFLHRFVSEVPFEVLRLNDGLAARFLEHVNMGTEFSSCAESATDLLIEEFGDDEFNRGSSLIVCCCADSTLGQMGKSAAHAQWGCHLGRLAAIYHHDPNVIPYLIWHEMCHLFGAEDCYEINAANEVIRDRTCDNDNCIMQYVPCKERLGDSPIICNKKNVGLIQKWASRRT